MGRKGEGKWVYILKDAQLFYKESQINKFIEMWNAGEPIGTIAHEINMYGYDIKKRDVALLVMHCEIENLISPRDGGLLGNKDKGV